jgi:hypothetical protein
MMIHAGIVAMRKMYAVVRSAICMIACGDSEVVIVTVCIARIDSHPPCVAYHINRTEEIVTIHKLTVLTIAEHIHEVLIAHIKQIVVIVYGIIITVNYIVNHFIHLIEEIEVNLIHIFVLAIVQSEFISHTVGEETGLATNIRQTHSCKTPDTDSCQGYKQDS